MTKDIETDKKNGEETDKEDKNMLGGRSRVHLVTWCPISIFDSRS